MSQVPATIAHMTEQPSEESVPENNVEPSNEPNKSNWEVSVSLVTETDDVPMRADPEKDLAAAAEEFLDSQRTVIKIIDFLADSAANLDDRRTSAVAQAVREYPGVDRAVIEGLVYAVSGLRESALEEEAGEGSDAERIQTALTAALESIPPDHLTPNFVLSVLKAEAREPSTPRMLSSLLMTLVSDFEVLMSRITRALMHHDASPLWSSDKTYSLEHMFSFASLEAIQSHEIDKQADDLLKKSADTWFSFLKGRYGLALPAHSSSLELREVFNRRHLVVHTGGVVSREYLQRMEGLSNPPALGQRLEVSAEYLKRAADLLWVVGFSAAANATRKISTEDESVRRESQLVNLPYRLLQDERFWPVVEVAKIYPTRSFLREYSGLVFQVNGWLAMKRMGEFEKCRDEVLNWQTDVLQPIFQLVKFALLDDMESGHKLVLELRGTDSLPLDFWLTWPLLKELRAYEASLKTQDN
jgi:hypothetical protein